MNGQQATAPQPAPRRNAPPPVPPEFQADKIMAMDAAQATQLLKDPASAEFQKSKACMRLAMVGTKDSVPALAGLLKDPKLSHYARFGLAPIPDPSVDEVLRSAMRTLKGTLLVGVIDTVGQRKDAKAIPAFSALLYGADAEAAKAAAAALGKISGPQATAALQAGLVKTKGAVRNEIAAACLVCADGLLASGDRKGALALYDTLTRSGIPKSVRLAAMNSTISAERSLTRPRVAPASK
jgi:HEAT repeat protein